MYVIFYSLPQTWIRKRPPGLEVSIFNLRSSFLILFCLESQNVRPLKKSVFFSIAGTESEGKDVCFKICFNSFSNITKSSTSMINTFFEDGFVFSPRGYDALNDVLHGRFSAASFCKASSLNSVDLSRHASALSCSQLQNLCLHFGVLDSLELFCWKILKSQGAIF